MRQTPDHHINPATDYVSSVSIMPHRRTANWRRTNEPSFLMTSQIYNNKFFFKQSAHHPVSHAMTNRMLLTDNNTNITRSIALTTKPAAQPQELSLQWHNKCNWLVGNYIQFTLPNAMWWDSFVASNGRVSCGWLANSDWLLLRDVLSISRVAQQPSG